MECTLGRAQVCCSICEYCGIESVQHRVQQVLRGRFVYIALCNVLVEHSVKAECLIFHTLALWHNRSGEPLDGSVFWGIKDTMHVLAGISISNYSTFLQAFLVHHFDDRSDAFLLHVRSWCGCQRSVTEEQWPIFGARYLSCLADGERAHTDSDLNAGCAICASGHVCCEIRALSQPAGKEHKVLK